MKKEMKQRRKWGKLIFIWSAVFFLASAVLIKDASAVLATESAGKDIRLVIGVDSEGNNIFASIGVAVLFTESTEGILYTELYDVQSAGVGFFLDGDDVIVLDEDKRRDDTQYNYTVWDMENLDAEVLNRNNAFYYGAYAVQNETVSIIYFSSDKKVSSATTVLRELNNEGLLETDGLPGDIKYYPAAVVDENGYCVGIVTEPGLVIPLVADEEKFYGQSSGDSSGNDGNGDSGDSSGNDGNGDSGDGGSDAGSGQRRRDMGGMEDSDESDEPDDTSNFLKDNAIYIGIGIAVAAVLMLVFFTKKKQNQQSRQTPGGVQGPIQQGYTEPTGPIQQGYTEPTGPIQQGYAGPTGPVQQGYAGPTGPVQQGYAGPTGPIQQENIGSTRPVQQGYGSVNFEAQTPPPTPKPQVYLRGLGGCMDGRKYPVGKNEVTIGRYRSNVICYPEGTPGVSRTHAKLYWDGGKLMLMDCNSSSGTYLKRVGRLQPMSPVEVNCGDVFYVGEKKNGFEINR